MATELTSTEKVIRDFLIEEVLYDKQLTELDPEEPLLKNELMDSIAVLQTVAFCEQIFEISIPEEELLPDHFETVRAIAQLVERRIASKLAAE